MMRTNPTFLQLIERNKEEIVKDKSMIEKIERRLEKRHAEFMKRQN